jgi:phenylacetate-CoA ligase
MTGCTSEENLVLEIANEGRAVATGESGEILVTDLHNYGMPFLRYANGDVGTMAPEGPCTCGRSLRKIAHLDGRRVDTLRDAHGNPVPGMLFISLLQSEMQVRSFQVIQQKSGAIELRVVRGNHWDAARFDKVVARLTAYFRGLPVRVVFCERIAASALGKRRPIVVENRP